MSGDLIFYGILGIALVIGVVTMLMLVLNNGGGGGSEVNKRASELRSRLERAQTPEDAKSLRRRQEGSRYAIVDVIIGRLPSINRLRNRLARSGKNITAEKYIGLCLGIIFFIAFGLAGTTEMPLLLTFLLGLIMGLGIPHFFISRMITKRLNAFMKLFPDAIELIVRGLRSGLPLQEGLKIVSHEINDPVKSEFRHITELINLGVTVDKALKEVAAKLDMTEFNFFVTSIILQRETGGNLAEILGNIAETIRNRHTMQMKIKALSSEARASALIVGALPVVVVGMLQVISPEYTDPLIDDFRGNVAAAIAVGSLISGMLIMRRMSNFEI